MYQAGRDIHIHPATGPQHAGSQFEAWKLPARNPNFTGRDAALESLHKAMRSVGTVTVHSLRGMGGVGKSQLAVEYAYRFAEHYDVVWWVPAEQPAVIPQHLAALGVMLNVTVRGDVSVALYGVLTLLRKRSRWLIIFDNAEDPESLQEFIPQGPGRVLITTRRDGFSAVGGVLDLDVLDRRGSVALIRRRLPSTSAEEAHALADALGDLPLAVEQASAYIAATGLPVHQYLHLLRIRTSELIAQGRVLGHRQTLATLWDLSLSMLARQSAGTVQLLEIMSHLAPEPIPLDFFTDRADVLPEPLAHDVTNPIMMANAVGMLMDHYLIRRNHNDISVVHRLLQESLRGYRDRTQTHSSWHPHATAVRLTASNLSAEIIAAPQNWSRWRTLLPHVLAVCDDSDGRIPLSGPDERAWLLDRAGTYLQVHGRLADAKPLFERALALDEATRGPDHPEVATRLNNLGVAVAAAGQAADAAPLLQRALEISTSALGDDHPTIATRLSNLGLILSAQKRSTEAKPLLERALAIDERVYGADDPGVATDLSSLGVALTELGEPSQAEPLFRRAISLNEATYGEHHPNIATDLTNLGVALIASRRFREAVGVYQRALAIDEAVYGAEHPVVASDLRSLSVALTGLGRYEEAKVLRERAERIRHQHDQT